MGKVKTLLVDLVEFEDEIIDLLYRVRDALPTSFALFFDDDLSSKSIIEAARNFSDDEALIMLTVHAIKMGVVEFNDTPTKLSFKIPLHLTSEKEDDINT